MRHLSYFVLESVPSPFQVHVLCIGVIEAALTELTVESDHLTTIITDLLETVQKYMLSEKKPLK